MGLKGCQRTNTKKSQLGSSQETAYFEDEEEEEVDWKCWVKLESNFYYAWELTWSLSLLYVFFIM
mgnify:CR=1 FL=1